MHIFTKKKEKKKQKKKKETTTTTKKSVNQFQDLTLDSGSRIKVQGARNKKAECRIQKAGKALSG
jgi:hypothetical protein